MPNPAAEWRWLWMGLTAALVVVFVALAEVLCFAVFRLEIDESIYVRKNLDGLPATTPPALRTLIARCLRRSGGNGAPVLRLPLQCFGLRPVVYADVVSRFAEPASHRVTHDAQADKCHFSPHLNFLSLGLLRATRSAMQLIIVVSRKFP